MVISPYDHNLGNQDGFVKCIIADEYLSRLENKIGTDGAAGHIAKTIEESRGKLPADPRMNINGHDLINSLSVFSHRVIKNKDLANFTSLARSMLLTLEVDRLMNYQLFQSIEN